MKRNKLKFGEKEIINRFIFVKKFRLSNIKFGIGTILLIFRNFFVIVFEINNILRVLGNIKGIFRLLIKNY